jgi:hypothetical protein
MFVLEHVYDTHKLLGLQCNIWHKLLLIIKNPTFANLIFQKHIISNRHKRVLKLETRDTLKCFKNNVHFIMIKKTEEIQADNEPHNLQEVSQLPPNWPIIN